MELKELDQFLSARALQHDPPTLLFRLACDYLRSARVVRPGPEWLSRRVAAAREVAKAETYQRIEPVLNARLALRSELDGLLVVDPDLGSTRLHWLRTGPTRPSPAAVKAELAKYAFLRGLDAHSVDLSMLPAERRRFLATIGRRSTAQALTRRDPERRYPGMDRLRRARESGPRRLPPDHGHLGMVEASYSHLREFTPAVLASIRFDGATAARPLLEAVRVLVDLNATGARKVPDDAPADFVPTRWRGYLERAAASGDVTAYRHYWELCFLLTLRDGLRCGDVFVPGSRRYADPASFLLTPAQWEPKRAEFCALVERVA